MTFLPFKCRNYQQMWLIKWFISRFLTKYSVDFQWDKCICAFLCAYKTCKNIQPALQHWLQFLSLGSFNPWTFLVLSVLSACVAEAAPFRTCGSVVVSLPYRLMPSSHEHRSRFSFSRSLFVTRFFRLFGPPEEKEPSVSLYLYCVGLFLVAVSVQMLFL